MSDAFWPPAKESKLAVTFAGFRAYPVTWQARRRERDTWGASLNRRQPFAISAPKPPFRSRPASVVLLRAHLRHPELQSSIQKAVIHSALAGMA
jgi:hypothetical protein